MRADRQFITPSADTHIAIPNYPTSNTLMPIAASIDLAIASPVPMLSVFFRVYLLPVMVTKNVYMFT